MAMNLSDIQTTWNMFNENGDEQKENKTPVRKSGRKSWFETPRSSKLEIAVERKKRRSSGGGKRRSEEMETLLLTHFTNPPRVDFGKVKVNTSRTRHLVLKNPHEYEQEVVIEKFPFKKRFSIDETKHIVGPEDSLVISITWCPEENGSCREMMLFKIDGLYRLQAFLLGTADLPKTTRKGTQRKGILGAKVKRPFSILHTPGLACIRDNYSPQELEDKPRWRPQREPVSNNPNQPDSGLEKNVVFTPPTHESTIISKPAGSTMSHSVKTSDLGCSPSLLKSVSPIAHTSDDNHLLDSYCAVRHVPPLGEVSIDSKITGNGDFSKCCEPGSKLVFETPLKDNLTSDNQVEGNEICTDSNNHIIQTDYDIPPSVKYLSPETFLNDSLSVKSKQTDGVQPSQLFLPFGDRFATVVVSPNSFLEDLNASKCETSVKSPSEIPSPSSILNDSIPHDVMLKQLSTVRTSLIGQNRSHDKLTLSCSGNNKVNFFQPDSELISGFSLFKNDHTPGRSKKSLAQNILRKEDRFQKIPNIQSPRRTTYLVKKTKDPKHHAKQTAQTNVKKLSRTQKYSNIHKAGVNGKKKLHQANTGSKEDGPSGVTLSVVDSLAKTPVLNMSGSETVTKVRHSGVLNLSGSDTVVKIKQKAPLNLSGSETITKVKHDGVNKTGFSAGNSIDSAVTDGDVIQESAKPFTIATTNGKFTSVKRLFAGNSGGISAQAGSDAITDNGFSSETLPKGSKSPGHLSLTDIGSPQPLPESPNVEVSKRTTRTITKIRASDALLQATNRTFVNKQLFNNERSERFEQVHIKTLVIQNVNLDPTVKSFTSEELTEKTSDAYERSSEECEENDVPDQVSGQCTASSECFSSDYRSPSHALPNSPVIENCRRSTHIIANPKILNPNASPKILFSAMSATECHEKAAVSSNIATSKDELHSIALVESCLVQSCHIVDQDSTNRFMESTRIDSCPDILVTPPCVSIIADDCAESQENNLCFQNELFSRRDSLQRDEKKKSGEIEGTYTRVEEDDKTRRRKVTASRRSSEYNSNKTSSASSSLLLNSKSKNLSFPAMEDIGNNQRTGPSDFKKKKSVLKPAVRKPVQKRAISDDLSTAGNDQYPSKLNKVKHDTTGTGKKKGLLWRLTSGRKIQPSKVVAQPKLILMKHHKTGVPKHPMPYAAKNMYYDERWRDKQDRGFVKWLNFILTPSDEYNYAVSKTKVDVGSLFIDGNKDGTGKRAPTKEVLSFRAYAARRRLNRLRRAACRLYQSEELISVILKIEAEVDKLGLAVRKDRMLHADIGIKQRILDMLLCYNPLWLRIGLETVFGEILPLQSNSDVVGMSRFILCRLVDSPDLAKEFSHPTVPHLYRNGYAEAVAQHTLKKFLLVVFFLDRAKTFRLIDHDPCLFCKDADIKASRDLLVCFSRDYLSGEGDITRHLSYLGYTVTHMQTTLDEFDYSVTKLGVDLRDGFRLMRALEFLTGERSLVKQLRGPAISRIQKMHNVSVVFNTLADRGLDISQVEGGKICARDIVDGHREKTLKLLWYLIFHFQVDILINKKELKEEIKYLERSLRVKVSMQKYLHVHQDSAARRDSGETDFRMEKESLSLLLQWCRVVCLHYGVKVENFTVSFSDGRALCCLVHHYHPSLLPLDAVHLNTSQSYTQRLEDLDSHRTDRANASLEEDSSFVETQVAEDADLFDTLLNNEKQNFKLLYEKMSELGGVPLMLKSTDMTNTIPDEKVVVTCVTYLCGRLLDVRHESRAARTIQLAWRGHRVRRAVRARQKEEKAARILQKAVRLFLKHRRNKHETRAAVLIQSVWRGCQARQRARLVKMTKHNKEMIQAALKIQAVLKGCVVRRQYVQKQKAVATIQAVIRGFLVRQDIKRKNTAAEKIQNFYRGYMRTKDLRKRFVTLRTSALTLQRAHRAHLAAKHSRELHAAVCIQQFWRRFRERRYCCSLKTAALTVQKNARMKKKRREFLKLKMSAVKMQQLYRANKVGQATRVDYVRSRRAVCELQSRVRAFVVRRRYLALKRAAVFVQKNFRRYKCQVRYRATRLAAIIIKRAYRNYKRRTLRNKEEKKRTAASVCVQQWWRRQKQMEAVKQNMEAVKQENAVLKVQSYWRAYKVRKDFMTLRKATVMIQSNIRAFIARRRFLRMVAAVIVLQHHVRDFLQRKRLQSEVFQRTLAAVVVQRMWRMRKARKEYVRTYRAILVLQKNFAMLIARKCFLKKKRAALVLQNYIRKLIHSKASKREQAEMKSAAVVIQSWWRGCRAYQMYSTKRRAAILIQKEYRSYKLHRQHLLKIRAAKIIQQRLRAVLSGRRVRMSVCQMHHAATVIQKNWRTVAAKKHYLVVKQSVTILQSYVRMWHARNHYQKIKNAICILQTRFRAHVNGKKTRENYLLTRNNVVKIQTFLRGSKCRREFVAMRKAVIIIQSFVRMHQQRRWYRKVMAAVCVIQTRFRHHKSAVATRNSYLAIRHGIVCLQSHVRRRIHSKRYHEKRTAVVKLQSFVRMHKQRQEFLKLKDVAVYTQRLYRRRQIARRHRALFLVKRRACVTLQHAIRNMLQQRRLRQNLAARTIQTVVRGCLARKEFLKIKRSVIVLQSYVRMYQACRNFRKKQHAAVIIQQRYRSYLQIKKARQEFVNKRKSAITIQAAFRAYLVQKVISKKQKAVRLIEATYQMYVIRKSYFELKKCTLKIQRFYRNQKTARQQRVQYLQLKCAAGVIQRRWRGVLVRSHQQKMKMAAIKIQSAYRCHRQRRYFVKLCDAVLLCQSLYRAQQLQRRERRGFLMQVGAAVTIQALFRCYVARKKYHDLRRKVLLIQAAARMCVQRRKYLRMLHATRSIQTHFRAHQSSVRARHAFLHVRSSVVILQTAFRKWKMVQMEQHEQAAVVIQSYFKMWKHRVQYQRMRCAVVCIQSVVRGFLSRCQYHRRLEAIKLLQRNIRLFILLTTLRREVLRRNKAAGLIQSTYKKYKIRQDIKRKTAIVRIQASVRQFLERRRFCRIQQQIITLQKVTRGYLARKSFMARRRRHQAAVTLQRAVRRHWAADRAQVCREKRKAYLEHISRVVCWHLAATRIQRCYRRHLVLERARKTLHNVIVIQRYTRTVLARLKFIRLRSSVVLIQRKVREWILRRNQAARIIQRATVKWLHVLKEKRLHGQAAKIQAAWKGYYVRQNTKSKKIKTARLRIAEANSSATEEKKLGNRTTSALDYLLRYHQLSYILEALIHLDVATRLSPRCCERLVEVNAVHVVYRLIQSCNRSLPHMELIKYAANVLLNLVKYDKTRLAVYEVEDAASILVELMAVYRDKGLIFSKTCTLLGILALDSNIRNDIISQTKVVEKIQTIHLLTLRKHSIEETQRVRRAKLAAQRTFNSTLPLPTPSRPRLIRPEWALRRNSFQGIQDPLVAINFVMETLHIKPKKV